MASFSALGQDVFSSGNSLLEEPMSEDELSFTVEDCHVKSADFECDSAFDYYLLASIWVLFKLILVCHLLFATPIYSAFHTLLLMAVEMCVFSILVALTPRRLAITATDLVITTTCSIRLCFAHAAVTEVTPTTWKKLSLFNFSSSIHNRVLLTKSSGFNIIVSPAHPEAFMEALCVFRGLLPPSQTVVV